MKQRKVVTYLDCKRFEKEYLGVIRKFIELSFIEIKQDNRLEALKILTTENKLNNALQYRGLKELEKSKKYELWLADYKGDRKLKFSGIKPL